MKAFKCVIKASNHCSIVTHSKAVCTILDFWQKLTPFKYFTDYCV